MGWDSAPPTPQELSASSPQGGWDSAPPTAQELVGIQQSVGLPPGLNPSDTENSLVRGAISAITGGHMPQIAGAIEHPTGALKTLLGGGTGHDVSADPDVQSYAKTRDQYKNLYDQAYKDHPYAYGTGYVPGILASPLNKLGALPAAGLFAEGASNADLTKGEIGQDVYDTSKGVITGKVLGSALEAATPLIQKGAQNLAIKHLRPTAATAANLGSERLGQIGQEALDSGAIKAGSKIGATAERLRNLSDEVGALKGDIVNQSDAHLDPTQIADRFDKEVIEPLRGTAENQSVVQALEAKKQSFLDQYTPEEAPADGAAPDMTPAQVEAEKTAVQGNINYNTDPSVKVQGMKGWASVLRQSGEDAISDPAFIPAKQSYGNLESAQGMAERTAGLVDGGTGLLGHIGDTAANTMGIGGAVAGHPASLAIPVARSLTKGRVASAGAVTLDSLGKALKSNPQIFGAYAAPLAAAAQRGSDALSATHFILSQQSPEYRDITDILTGSPVDSNVTQ